MKLLPGLYWWNRNDFDYTRNTIAIVKDTTHMLYDLERNYLLGKVYNNKDLEPFEVFRLITEIECLFYSDIKEIHETLLPTVKEL